MSVAIIAEFNPFHNGHIFLIKQAKLQFPNDKIIILLSQKYTQRGEIAVTSYEIRKQFALKYGADEVYPLDFYISTQAAHIFAHGAVKLANDLKIDKLFFGSETNDIAKFIKIAQTIKENEPEYNKMLKSFLKQGFGFPSAAAQALKELSGADISLPNDILGLEYVKAIIYNNYSIKPYCIQRTIDFHSDHPNEHFASASYLRNLIYRGEDISSYSPMIFDQIPDRIENYYQEFKQIVLSKTPEELAQIHLVSEGLENRFKKFIYLDNYHSFVNGVNSKRYTSSRIKRIILYILLDIKKIQL